MIATLARSGSEKKSGHLITYSTFLLAIPCFDFPQTS